MTKDFKGVCKVEGLNLILEKIKSSINPFMLKYFKNTLMFKFLAKIIFIFKNFR